MTTPDPIDFRLRAFYQASSVAARSATPRPARTGRGRLVALVAVLAGLTVLGAMVTRRYSAVTATRLVVAEIALNHRKALEPDVHADDLPSLGPAMIKLDFTPILPTSLRPGLAVAGGRYCSVQGVIATQVRMHAANGQRYTLYQWRDRPAFRRLLSGERQTGGVRVRLWKEAGLVMGLAWEPDSAAVSPAGRGP